MLLKTLYVFILLITGIKYIVGLETYGLKSACFEHGEKWVQKMRHKQKEQLIETQRQWGAGCYEVTRYCDDQDTSGHTSHNSTGALIKAF